jgi:hypothetical protein
LAEIVYELMREVNENECAGSTHSLSLPFPHHFIGCFFEREGERMRTNDGMDFALIRSHSFPLQFIEISEYIPDKQ